jgi:hypothetical protein
MEGMESVYCGAAGQGSTQPPRASNIGSYIAVLVQDATGTLGINPDLIYKYT